MINIYGDTYTTKSEILKQSKKAFKKMIEAQEELRKLFNLCELYENGNTPEAMKKNYHLKNNIISNIKNVCWFDIEDEAIQLEDHANELKNIK